MKRIYYIIIMLASSSCGGRTAEPESVDHPGEENIVSLTEEQIKTAGIVTGAIEQRDLSTAIRLNGRIDVPPQNLVSVSAPLGGYLMSTEILPGTPVKRGQIIAMMEDQQYIQLQQDYLSSRIRLNLLEREYQRQKVLNSEKASSDKIWEQADAEYRNEQVRFTALNEKLRLVGIDPNNLSETRISRVIPIRSPIDGFVSKVNVNIGKYVMPTDVMFELINSDDIHLALKVFERDLEKIYVGQSVIAYTNNDSDRKYMCKVVLIGRDLSADRNAEVHCHFESYDKRLVPGTYMNADVLVKTIRASVLPSDALVLYDGHQYVFKVAGGRRFEIMEVGSGESEGNFTEVKMPANGNLPGTLFVTQGAYSLLMMMKNKSE